MADGKQTTIGVSRERYAQLAEKKRALEGAVDQHFSWGTFLSILAGLQPINEFDSKDQNEFKGISSWASKKEVKRIARAEGNRVIRSLKEVNVSR